MLITRTFKARIGSTQTIPSNSGKQRFSERQELFIFSKKRMQFPFGISNNSIEILGEKIYHNDEYELIKLDRFDNAYTDNSKYQARFKNGAIINIIADRQNEMKLKLIHGLYWFQKREYKTVIVGAFFTAVFAAIIVIPTCNRNNHAGKSTGIKEEKHKCQLRSLSAHKPKSVDCQAVSK